MRWLGPACPWIHSLGTEHQEDVSFLRFREVAIHDPIASPQYLAEHRILAFRNMTTGLGERLQPTDCRNEFSRNEVRIADRIAADNSADPCQVRLGPGGSTALSSFRVPANDVIMGGQLAGTGFGQPTINLGEKHEALNRVLKSCRGRQLIGDLVDLIFGGRHSALSGSGSSQMSIGWSPLGPRLGVDALAGIAVLRQRKRGRSEPACATVPRWHFPSPGRGAGDRESAPGRIAGSARSPAGEGWRTGPPMGHADSIPDSAWESGPTRSPRGEVHIMSARCPSAAALKVGQARPPWPRGGSGSTPFHGRAADEAPAQPPPGHRPDPAGLLEDAVTFDVEGAVFHRGCTPRMGPARGPRSRPPGLAVGIGAGNRGRRWTFSRSDAQLDEPAVRGWPARVCRANVRCVDPAGRTRGPQRSSR